MKSHHFPTPEIRAKYDRAGLLLALIGIISDKSDDAEFDALCAKSENLSVVWAKELFNLAAAGKVETINGRLSEIRKDNIYMAQYKHLARANKKHIFNAERSMLSDAIPAWDIYFFSTILEGYTESEYFCDLESVFELMMHTDDVLLVYLIAKKLKMLVAADDTLERDVLAHASMMKLKIQIKNISSASHSSQSNFESMNKVLIDWGVSSGCGSDPEFIALKEAAMTAAAITSVNLMECAEAGDIQAVNKLIDEHMAHNRFVDLIKYIFNKNRAVYLMELDGLAELILSALLYWENYFDDLAVAGYKKSAHFQSEDALCDLMVATTDHKLFDWLDDELIKMAGPKTKIREKFGLFKSADSSGSGDEYVFEEELDNLLNTHHPAT